MASSRLLAGFVRLPALLKNTTPIAQKAQQQLSSTSFVSGRKLFSENHEYLDITGNKARLGITDHAQKELGDVVYVDLPEADGQVLEQGEVACSVESVKAVADVYMTVSGKIVATNNELTTQPELINSSPYEKGWLMEIELTDEKQLDSLMDEEAYEHYLDPTD